MKLRLPCSYGTLQNRGELSNSSLCLYIKQETGFLRQLLLCLAVGISGLAFDVYGGAQQYEPLADSVRTALSAAVVLDRTPPEPYFSSPLEKARWLAKMSESLPHRHKPSYQSRIDFLKTVHYEATRAGLEPDLVLGLIQVESGFRKYAISKAGARGYMQIMPFWVKLIADGDTKKLFDMRANIRMGCVILRHYLTIEKGDLFLALGRYNGSRGRSEYPNAVLSARKRWEWKPNPVPELSSAPPAIPSQEKTVVSRPDILSPKAK